MHTVGVFYRSAVNKVLVKNLEAWPCGSSNMLNHPGLDSSRNTCGS